MAAYILSDFPVRCPRSGGTLQAPLLPSAQACPRRKEEKIDDKRTDKGKYDPLPTPRPLPMP